MIDFKCRPIWSSYFFDFGERRKWTQWWRSWWHNAPLRIFGLEPPLFACIRLETLKDSLSCVWRLQWLLQRWLRGDFSLFSALWWSTKSRTSLINWISNVAQKVSLSAVDCLFINTALYNKLNWQQIDFPCKCYCCYGKSWALLVAATMAPIVHLGLIHNWAVNALPSYIRQRSL